MFKEIRKLNTKEALLPIKRKTCPTKNCKCTHRYLMFLNEKHDEPLRYGS